MGEPVAAIGSPFGQAQSLSVGHRLRDRPLRRVADRLRDRGRDPDRRGDQPGQLRRAAGRRRRARDRRSTSRSRSRSGGGEGVGFAVPIDIVKRSVGQLREDGTAALRLPRRVLGAAVSAARRPFRARRWRRARGSRTSTRAARPPRPGCAAAAASEAFQGAPFARGGDVITKVGDAADRRTPTTSRARSPASSRARPSTVEIHRGGETQSVKVKLGERPRGG